MSDQAEAIWRAALERRGKDWVSRELETRFGRPDDKLLDVVFEAPYPTREFCQRWCAEQDGRLLAMSGYTKAVIVAFIVFAAVAARAVSALESYHPPSQAEIAQHDLKVFFHKK